MVSECEVIEWKRGSHMVLCLLPLLLSSLPVGWAGRERRASMTSRVMYHQRREEMARNSGPYVRGNAPLVHVGARIATFPV